MSSAAFYTWRAKFGGMDASLMARRYCNPCLSYSVLCYKYSFLPLRWFFIKTVRRDKMQLAVFTLEEAGKRTCTGKMQILPVRGMFFGALPSG